MNTSPQEHTDPLVRDLIQATDPLRGGRVPRLPLSAAQIRADVEATTGYRVRTRFRRLLRQPVGEHRSQPRQTRLMVALPLVMASILAVVFGVRALTGTHITAAQTPAGPGVLEYEQHSSTPARATLQELAAKVSTSDTALRRYTHVRLQTWSADTTAPGSQAAKLIAHDQQVWWAADHSGVQQRTTLPPQTIGLRRADWLAALPQKAPVEQTEYAAGEYAVAVDNPSPFPPVLAGQLAYHQNGVRPEQTVRAAADMYRYHCLDIAQRSATLQVLADTDNLVYRGWVADRAGRTGLAVSVDSGTADVGVFRDLIIIDPRTGSLLSHEQLMLVVPPRLNIRAPAVMSYVLYLACETTDTRP